MGFQDVEFLFSGYDVTPLIFRNNGRFYGLRLSTCLTLWLGISTGVLCVKLMVDFMSSDLPHISNCG